MKRNGRLLMDIYIHPGTSHMSGMNPSLPAARDGEYTVEEAVKIFFMHFMETL